MTWSPLRCYTSIIWSSAFVQASSTLSMGRARTWPTEATRHRNAFLPFSHGFSFIESFKELCALCRNALSAEQEHFGNGSTEGHCVSLVGIILDCYRLPVFLLNWVSAVKSINCDSDSIAWDLELVSIICIAPFFFVCGPNVAEAGGRKRHITCLGWKETLFGWMDSKSPGEMFFQIYKYHRCMTLALVL